MLGRQSILETDCFDAGFERGTCNQLGMGCLGRAVDIGATVQEQHASARLCVWWNESPRGNPTQTALDALHLFDESIRVGASIEICTKLGVTPSRRLIPVQT